MKAFTVISLLALVAAVASRPETHYTDRYDNVDLEAIIRNRRLLLPYIKCVLDQGKCSPDGKELKSHIQEALENYCAKCTEPHRAATRRVIAHLINQEPDYWHQLTVKYDSDRKYVTKYESELRSISVT